MNKYIKSKTYCSKKLITSLKKNSVNLKIKKNVTITLKEQYKIIKITVVTYFISLDVYSTYYAYNYPP